MSLGIFQILIILIVLGGAAVGVFALIMVARGRK